MKRNLLHLQALADQQYLVEIFRKWSEASDNKELAMAVESFARLTVYINSLEQEAYTFDTILDGMQKEKNDALLQLKDLNKLKDRLQHTEYQLKKFGYGE